MPQQQCRELPAELWIIILFYVDDLTLWITCRGISRMIRMEAKREFRRQRIKHLHIQLLSSMPRQLPICYAMHAHGSRLVAIDDHRATFHLHISPWMIDILSRTRDADTLFRSGVYKLLGNYDWDVEMRLHPEPSFFQLCKLGPYILDAPLPNLSNPWTQKSTISFDWKPFLDLFLGVFARSQDQARNENCNEFDPDIMEANLRATFGSRKIVEMNERTHWVKRYGSAEARNCLQDAYAARVTRFYKKHRLQFGPNLDRADYNLDEAAWRRLEIYIDRVVITMNSANLKTFMDKHGIMYKTS